jgi:signal transduction histidine kinase
MTRGQSETVLVASHISATREEVAGVLRRAGHGVRTAATAGEALEAYDRDPTAVVVADHELPDREGSALTGLLRARQDDAVVVILCDRAGVEDIVALMKEGAFHVLQKPVAPDQLIVVVQKALEHGRLCRGNRDLKNQLDISEKLAMIGRLASGVAHELNNPLDGVRRYVRMTQEGLEEEERDLSEYLDRAMNGLSRMAGIVRQLLTFSRNIVIEHEAENLRTMMEEVVRTLAPTGSGSPTVRLENPYVDIQVPRVLFQVFVNLLKNALDAVEAHGARGLVKVHVSRNEQDQIEIRVEDNGAGIATDDLRRVFEPFFTTKEVGRGTGLGLPISARIVERCGGTIRIESEKGSGTTVHVSLPVGAAATSATRALQGAER